MYEELFAVADKARENAYAPYSGFRVGAALLTKSGKVYTGCNIENASYTPTNCAERTAFFKAISEGEREFEAIAVAGGKNDGKSVLCPPCGVCLQVMLEFCERNFKIILRDENSIRQYLLSELAPLSFNKSMIENGDTED